MAPAATVLRRTTLCLVAVAFLVVVVTSASAGTSQQSALSCQSASSQPFLPWLDPAAYTLAPGGGFEGKTSQWKLSGGAKLVSGNEPFRVNSSRDARSLSIPAGGSAVSPAFCVGLGEPTLRFFAVGGGLLSTLKVEVLYRTALGTTSQTVAVVPRMGSWGPTLQISLLANVLGLTSLDGLTTSVQVRLGSMGTAGWTVDDVYVDPWKVT